MMSFAQINAELENLSADELRQLAVESWKAFPEREGRAENSNLCTEDDPRTLAALDEAIAAADMAPGRGHSAAEVRRRLAGWTSR